jgi:hypothetical protein
MKEKFSPASANPFQDIRDDQGQIAGFWKGLWHGLIAPITFLLSLFKENVGVYETHNNGKWYNFGFILGLMIVFGGNSGAGRKLAVPGDEEE